MNTSNSTVPTRTATRALRCSECGEPAADAHFLPSIEHPQRVEFACDYHDPGGYDLPLEGASLGAELRGHVRATLNGQQALALLDARVAGEAHR